MSQPTPTTESTYEPALRSVELLCERLGELDLPIGADTAREVLRAVLAIEAPRMEANVRDALQTSLDTIRIAAQAGLGVLASTTPVQTRPAPSSPPKPVLDPPPRRQPAAAPPARPTPTRRPTPRRNPVVEDDDDLGGEKRPVFRRPRGR
jgi:hypothetical protein